MTKYEKNRMKMFDGIDAVFSRNREAVESLRPLSEAVGLFRESKGETEWRNHEYFIVTAGATATKNAAFDVALEETVRLSWALLALGRKTGNEPLKAECRMPRSRLLCIRDADAVLHFVRISELAVQYAADIVDYGITAGEIASLGNLLETLKAQTGDQQAKTARRKASRKTLSASFGKTGRIVSEDLDVIMELMKTSHPDFYNEYRAARTICNLGGGHKAKTTAPPEEGQPENVTPMKNAA